MLIKNNQGYIALVTVLIILAVGIIIGVTVSLNAVNEMQMGLSSNQSEQAFYVADACADEAILRLKRDASLTTINNLSIGNGSCIIQIENLGGNNRRVKVTGQVEDYYRLIEIEVTVGSSWEVTSWKEVGEFTS
jgi:type II secretory pathway component PulK